MARNDDGLPVWGNRERREAARAARRALADLPRRWPTVEEILHAPHGSSSHDDDDPAAAA